MPTLYETDFYGWANEQAAVLRSGRVSQADLANIAEEIESLGRRERRELQNRLAVPILHLLEWAAQPDRRSSGWLASIREQRLQIGRHLRDNPSLEPVVDAAVIEAFELAVLRAEGETGLDVLAFPRRCPWTYTQMLAPDFWPDAA